MPGVNVLIALDSTSDPSNLPDVPALGVKVRAPVASMVTTPFETVTGCAASIVVPSTCVTVSVSPSTSVSLAVSAGVIVSGVSSVAL